MCWGLNSVSDSFALTTRFASRSAPERQPCREDDFPGRKICATSGRVDEVRIAGEASAKAARVVPRRPCPNGGLWTSVTR
jgi:hypothetical protein